MVKKEKEEKRATILALIVGGALILAVVALGVRDGWFKGGGKVVLSEEFYGKFTDYESLSVEEYEDLIKNNKTFVVFVDQGGCETATTLRGFVRDWAIEAKVKVRRIAFSKMKETSMYRVVKYYPSVVVIEKGKVRTFLRADSGEDADKYNDYNAFKSWIEQYI